MLDLCIRLGCDQFVCMHWQSLDEEMALYITKFKNHSFILKPCKLRYRAPTYEKPPKQDPSLYYTTMEQKKKIRTHLFETDLLLTHTHRIWSTTTTWRTWT